MNRTLLSSFERLNWIVIIITSYYCFEQRIIPLTSSQTH